MMSNVRILGESDFVDSILSEAGEAYEERPDRKVKDRSLLCYLAVRELGMSLGDLAREFEMSAAGIEPPVTKASVII